MKAATKPGREEARHDHSPPTTAGELCAWVPADRPLRVTNLSR